MAKHSFRDNCSIVNSIVNKLITDPNITRNTSIHTFKKHLKNIFLDELIS